MRKLKTISEQVYDYVIEMISTEKLQPGERITELDLLQELDTSRTPIREALKQLTADGVLVNYPRKGFFVKEFNVETSSLDYSIIAKLDAYCAELASPCLTEDDYNLMQNCIDEMDLAIENKNIERYQEFQHEFHKIYARKCPNYRLAELIETIDSRAGKAAPLFVLNEKALKGMHTANHDHKMILEAFKAHDIAKLTEIIEPHWKLNFN